MRLTIPLKNRARGLQLEWAEGDALRSNMQCAVEGEFRGAAAERFFGGNACNVGIIVLLGGMREDDVARVAIKCFRIRQEFADYCVRKMPSAAHRALLDVPGIRADLQHLNIVIRFENQQIRFAQVMLHQLRHVAEVGNYHNFSSIRAEAITNRVSSVMRNSERRNFDVANFEWRATANVFNALDFS